MKKLNTSLKALALCMLLCYPFISCSNSSDEDDLGPDPTANVSLYSYLETQDEYSILVEAINQIGYQNALNVDNAGSYTFFAPTNTAFEAYFKSEGIGSVKNIPTNTLTQIILNHLLTGKEKTVNEIEEGYHKTQAKEFQTQANIDMYVSKTNDVFTINGHILVMEADIDATNGVIHKIDQLIQPASIADFMKADPDLVNFYDAAKALDNDIFVKLNNLTSDLTVMIPSENAFLDMGTVTHEKLDPLLRYHILDESIIISSKFEDNTLLTTWEGNTISISLQNDLVITDKKGQTARLIVKDLVAWNGVAHVIDKVLLTE